MSTWLKWMIYLKECFDSQLSYYNNDLVDLWMVVANRLLLWKGHPLLFHICRPSASPDAEDYEHCSITGCRFCRKHCLDSLTCPCT